MDWVLVKLELFFGIILNKIAIHFKENKSCICIKTSTYIKIVQKTFKVHRQYIKVINFSSKFSIFAFNQVQRI